MSIIDFTQNVCKTREIVNKQITENFEHYFAMYTLSTIKNDMPNVEVSKSENSYIIKANTKESEEIINNLSKYKFSNFQNTLIPVFTKIDTGLLVEFKVDGEC